MTRVALFRSFAISSSLAFAALCGENATFASIPGRPRLFQLAEDLSAKSATLFLSSLK
jgi:hypothetical protein